jgi:peptide subunit release factor 1 (eRF1)
VREGHPTSDLAAAFERMDRWIRDEFREENRGVVIYTELGGDWFEALQFPVPIQNRLVVGERAVIAPLAQVLESYQHHGVILLDRERVRILSVYLGTLLDEIEVAGEPWPSPSDVQAGGYAQKRYQRRKAEEMRHFFKEFSKEVEVFITRYKPDDLVLLGTPENTAKFREFLSEKAQKMIVYTGPMAVDEPAPQVLLAIEPHLTAERKREEQETVKLMRERVSQDYLATAGFQSTLTALQEGKVDTLIIAQDQELDGTRCSKCGFVFARGLDRCPYDGASVTAGVNVVEEAVRMAEAQGAEVKFVPAGVVQDLRGVGALLRF